MWQIKPIFGGLVVLLLAVGIVGLSLRNWLIIKAQFPNYVCACAGSNLSMYGLMAVAASYCISWKA